MINNQQIRSIISFIGMPVSIGLVVAAALLLVFPEFRSQPNGLAKSETLDLRDGNLISGWAGPISYSAAVSRAAPSVVNI